ncbi:MAG TPA: hypothetical protein VK468_01505 [Pyrinomonadaceae bacterium]|nr:hypothetical protein [Pyrinomonadaceae bacterium]
MRNQLRAATSSKDSNDLSKEKRLEYFPPLFFFAEIEQLSRLVVFRGLLGETNCV